MVARIKSFGVSGYAILPGSRVLAAVCLVFFAPIFLVAAVLIKCESPGPVFMKQSRRGANGNMIASWEFRTVAVNDREAPVPGATPHTVLGAFLRDTRLVMLPRLLNMLRGELSFGELLE